METRCGKRAPAKHYFTQNISQSDRKKERRKKNNEVGLRHLIAFASTNIFSFFCCASLNFVLQRNEKTNFSYPLLSNEKTIIMQRTQRNSDQQKADDLFLFLACLFFLFGETDTMTICYYVTMMMAAVQCVTFNNCKLWPSAGQAGSGRRGREVASRFLTIIIFFFHYKL